ncbi:glucodextranase DOMON-like domain-containing protein [Cognatiyoonia sp. IB215182]|uniref:glucodextranase DOMON-like domain-containing protein n=1 Tax=Cognatiyoonia sp. IB215182 TaxID=3097353 RepID=UPI002A161441|nr:glucodextranase DOMON-like domain-containing protein [Cognatiyoonia sp. IB215182]MDX8352974.1 glucodextranase DOMON-like domain-containing protein [Cognatiyoonia sp. IB215182]
MKRAILASLSALLLSTAAAAETVSFTDPRGDDHGDGALVYPTNPVFRPGVFDLVTFKATPEGDGLHLEFEMAAPIRNEWNMAGGFDVQMFFVFIDTQPGGHSVGLPGLNIAFAENSGWERAIVVSPQPFERVVSEIRKAGDLAPNVIPVEGVSAADHTISAYVPLDKLPDLPLENWGFQVVVQSNEGFPEDNDLLTRRVNEFEGEYRFGGGVDGNCDPHVVDVLGGSGQLSYDCGTTMATIQMIRASDG